MRLLRSILILPPHLNSLIRLARNQPESRNIKHGAHNACLRIQTPRLRHRLHILEPMPCFPVEERDAPVVPAGEEDVILVHGNGVDYGIVALEILHKLSLGTQPLLYLPRRGGGEGVFGWMGAEGADALFVVREHTHRLAGRQVVHAHCAVQGGRDDLWVCRLGDDARDGAFVAREDVDVAAGAHVPDAHDAIAAAGAEDIQGGVQGESVDAAQVAVVVADYFVGFEVPAFDHFVLRAGEEVGMPWADC